MNILIVGGTVDIGLQAASVTMQALVDEKIQKVKVTARPVEAPFPTPKKKV
jgi:hypothetical protein